MSKKIAITVVSDIMCPWCFIGKRNMEQAIEKLGPQATFSIDWLPFMLNSSLPEEGMLLKEYIANVYGPQAVSAFDARHQQMVAKAKTIGINMGSRDKVYPTMQGHRLMEFVRRRDVTRADECMEKLFKAYFEQGIRPNDNAELIKIGESMGFNGSEIASFLASDEGRREVAEMDKQHKKSNISGVPNFTITAEGKKKIVLSGGQPPEIFLEAFESLL